MKISIVHNTDDPTTRSESPPLKERDKAEVVAEATSCDDPADTSNETPIDSACVELASVTARSICQLCDNAPESMHSIKILGEKMEDIEAKLYCLLECKLLECCDKEQEALSTLSSSLAELKRLVESSTSEPSEPSRLTSSLTYGVKAKRISNILMSNIGIVETSLAALQSCCYRDSLKAELDSALQKEIDSMNEATKDLCEGITSYQEKEDVLSSLLQMQREVESDCTEMQNRNSSKNDGDKHDSGEIAVLNEIISTVKALPLHPEPEPFLPEVPPGHTGGPRSIITCPVTFEDMDDPVILDSTCAHCISRSAFESWKDLGSNPMSCPVCGAHLRSLTARSNVLLKEQIALLKQSMRQLNPTTMTRETNQSSRDGNEGNKEDEHMTRTACDSSAKVVGDSLLQSTHPLEQEEKMPTEPLPEDEECSKPIPYHRRHSRPQFTVYCSSKHLSSSSKRSKKRYRCEGCRFYCAELARWGNYTGELNELAQMDGIGTIVFDEDGGELEGSWENNCVDGQAVHRLPSGEIFHGTWLDGKRSGKGKCFYKNGDIYEGEYDKGLKCGYGKMSYANGSSYEGYFVADKREGEGIMIHHTGSIYSGSWKENKREGEGIFQFRSNDVYTGKYEDDAPQGEGLFTSPDGSWYRGSFDRGLMHGTGTYCYASGNEYSGDWKASKKEGKGTFRFKNGDLYVGDFCSNEVSGEGVYWSAVNGSCYRGHFLKGKRNGLGVLWEEDDLQTIAIGDFMNDQQWFTVQLSKESTKLYEQKAPGEEPVKKIITREQGLRRLKRLGMTVPTDGPPPKPSAPSASVSDPGNGEVYATT